MTLPDHVACMERLRVLKRPPRAPYSQGPEDLPPADLRFEYDEYRCFYEAGHRGPHVGAREGSELGEAKEWPRA